MQSMAKFDLALNPPIMNAAGCLGFAPDIHDLVSPTGLGAFVTNPVSLGARTPARGVRYLPFASGLLLHTGYPNPGIKAVIRHYGRRWGRSSLPVIVHLLARGAGEVSEMVSRLEGVEGVFGLELGLPSDIEADQVYALAQAMRGELPFIVRLPLARSRELAQGVIEAGAAAVSLAAPRGALPGPSEQIIHGRLYGPGIFPLALEVVQQLVQAKIPVIGAGGLYRQEQIDAMLALGALAVQLDSILWKGGWR
jgi:dihydroorotate dehydrogenase (NAD+) catalytic subunit